MTTPTPPDMPEAAIENLRNHQTQLDMDGCAVGVSRQALDEVLAYLTRPTPPADAMPTDDVAGLAEKYVWSVHGRGASTSVGIQTRQLIRDAYMAGHAEALHPAPVTDAQREALGAAVRLHRMCLDPANVTDDYKKRHNKTVDKLFETISAALIVPAQAQVDVEKYGIAIRNAIFDSLQNYYLQHTASDDNEGYSLIDALTPPGGTVDKGQDESFLLADHISVAVCDRLTPKTQGDE